MFEQKWKFANKKLYKIKCIHTQVIQDADEFVSSSEHVWRN